MKSYRNALFLVLGLGFSLAHAQLHFEQEEIIYKAGLLDEEAEAVFRFKNVGDKVITITRVSSSCGCTVPRLGKKTYAPGESGEIRTIFTFGARLGLQKKQITVEVDSGRKASYRLAMVTKIPEWVVTQPRIMRWRLGEPATPKTFTATVADPERITLTGPEEELDGFKIKMEETGPGKYVFRISPKAPLTRASVFLRFSATVTDDRASKTRQFGVHCLIR